MIGTEMHRASKLMAAGLYAARRDSYKRVLNLTDLTVRVQHRPGLLRELRIWRDIVAGLYLEPAPQPATHSQAFRALLLMTPEASRQIPYVLT